MAKQVSRGIANVRAKFEDAALALQEAKLDPELLKDPNLPRFDTKPGRWRARPGTPCPLAAQSQVLGFNGNVTYCRSAAGQLTAIERWTNGEIEQQFAPYISYALWAWPGFSPAARIAEGKENDPIVKRLSATGRAMPIINEGGARACSTRRTACAGAAAGRTRAGGSSGTPAASSGPRTGRSSRPRGDGIRRPLYEMKPDVLRPWMEPVSVHAASPAQAILTSLRHIGTSSTSSTPCSCSAGS